MYLDKERKALSILEWVVWAAVIAVILAVAMMADARGGDTFDNTDAWGNPQITIIDEYNNETTIRQGYGTGTYYSETVESGFGKSDSSSGYLTDGYSSDDGRYFSYE